MKFQSIKGTKDILPHESGAWQALEEKIRAVMHVFGYREIRTPVFEETELFSRGIGELTDIVGKEMYTFEDRSGTSVTLKPEMTASVIRSYIQHNLGEQQPLVKVYYLAPMFRQERPQAGRLRQFHQFGAEAIGGQRSAIDAEIITSAMEVYREVGIGGAELRVNSVGCEKCRPAYKETLKRYLKPKLSKLSPESQRRFEQNPLRILDAKSETDRDQTRDAPLMLDHLCDECKAHFNELKQTLEAMSIPFAVDGRIVRGLDYYTKTAFEIVSRDLGSQDALAGGGRYDLLVKQLGGKDTPAVGFAAGIERLLMAMEMQKKTPEITLHPVVYLASADDSSRRHVVQEALSLRRKGIACELDHLHRSLKAQMREAGRQNAEFVVVIGGKELETGQVRVKNMRSGEEKRASLSDLSSSFSPHRSA
jgi:histidyl-tRNA synthetase